MYKAKFDIRVTVNGKQKTVKAGKALPDGLDESYLKKIVSAGNAEYFEGGTKDIKDIENKVLKPNEINERDSLSNVESSFESATKKKRGRKPKNAE